MPVIEITEKNKHLYQGKCVVLQSHIHDKKEVKPGEIVTKIGMDYFEALKMKVVRLYDPALDEEPVEMLNAQCSIVNETPEQLNNEPKKLGPKRKKKTN